MEGEHGLPTTLSATQQQQEAKSVFSGSLKIYTIPATDENDLLEFLVDRQPTIATLIRENVDDSPNKAAIFSEAWTGESFESWSNMALLVSAPMQLV